MGRASMPKRDSLVTLGLGRGENVLCVRSRRFALTGNMGECGRFGTIQAGIGGYFI